MMVFLSTDVGTSVGVGVCDGFEMGPGSFVSSLMAMLVVMERGNSNNTFKSQAHVIVATLLIY